MVSRGEGQQARRREVAAAAWQLFTEQGFAATTVRQIAHRAGVSAGTVMNAGGKDHLLLELMEAAIADHMAVAAPEDPDPAAAIWQRFERYFAFFAGLPDLAKAYGWVLLTAAGPEHGALTTKANAMTGLLAGDIRQRRPQVAPEDAQQAADAIFACYLRALATWGSNAADLPTVTERFRDQIAWQLTRFDPTPLKDC